MGIDPEGLEKVSLWDKVWCFAKAGWDYFTGESSALYDAPAAAVEFMENTVPVQKDLKNISEGKEPATWGGRFTKSVKCSSIKDPEANLDCVLNAQ